MAKIILTQEQEIAKNIIQDAIRRNISFIDIKKDKELLKQMEIYSNSKEIKIMNKKYSNLKYIYIQKNNVIKEVESKTIGQGKITIQTKRMKIKRTRVVDIDNINNNINTINQQTENKEENKEEIIERTEQIETKINKIDINFTSQISKRQIPLIDKKIKDLEIEYDILRKRSIKQIAEMENNLPSKKQELNKSKKMINNIVAKMWETIDYHYLKKDILTKEQLTEMGKSVNDFMHPLDKYIRSISSDLYVFGKYQENVESVLQIFDSHMNRWGKLNAIVKSINDNDTALSLNQISSNDIKDITPMNIEELQQKMKENEEKLNRLII